MVGKRRKAWLLAALCLMWIIWIERNRKMFHGMEEPFHRFKSSHIAIVNIFFFYKANFKLANK
ncbi:hypothetical protein ACSBR2_041540 [Camellia fascicularis]